MKVKCVHVYPDRLNGLYNSPNEDIAGLTLEQSQARYANKILMSMQTIIKKAIDLEKTEEYTDSEDKPILMIATPEFFYYTPKDIIISDKIFLETIVEGLRDYVKNLSNLVLFHFGSLSIESTGEIEYLEPPPVIEGGYEDSARDHHLSALDLTFFEASKPQTLEKKFFNLALYGQCGSSEKVHYYSKQHPYSEDPFLHEGSQVVAKSQNNFFIPVFQEGDEIEIGIQFLICFDTQFPQTQIDRLLQISNGLPEHGFTHIIGQGAMIEETSSFYTLSILADYKKVSKNPDVQENLYKDPWATSYRMFSYPPCEIGNLKENIKKKLLAHKLKTIGQQLHTTPEATKSESESLYVDHRQGDVIIDELPAQTEDLAKLRERLKPIKREVGSTVNELPIQKEDLAKLRERLHPNNKSGQSKK